MFEVSEDILLPPYVTQELLHIPPAIRLLGLTHPPTPQISREVSKDDHMKTRLFKK